MRKPLLLLLTFALIVTTARGVSASTDCQRWLADYKKALADKTSAQKLLAAKHRARAYAHRKLVQLTTPATPHPAPTRVSSIRPHLTPAQMLKKFDLLCGELPVDPAPQVLDARMSPDEFVSEVAMGGPVDLDALPGDDTLLAENAPLPTMVPLRTPRSAPAARTTPSSAPRPSWVVVHPRSSSRPRRQLHLSARQSPRCRSPAASFFCSREVLEPSRPPVAASLASLLRRSSRGPSPSWRAVFP